MHKYILLSVLLMLLVPGQVYATGSKPATIITTDGEIDDVDSFVRMLLMSNEFTIDGLVYSSSMFHYRGDGKGTTFTSEMPLTSKIYGERKSLRWIGTQWMEELIASYAEVYPVLSGHAPGYPAPDYLLSRVAVGNVDFEGEMASDTAGSELIKAKLLEHTSGPLYLQAWGGTNTIARALKSIEEEYKPTDQWQTVYEHVSAKAVLYIILDQDATYKNYIAKAWPEITVYLNTNQFGALAYWWKSALPAQVQPYFGGAFMGRHIINNHGPLTSRYYSWGDGKKQAGDEFHTHGDAASMATADGGPYQKFDFISEGDSPAFIHLIDVGLDSTDNPGFGGWSGRLQQSASQPSLWKDGDMTFTDTFHHINTVKDINPHTGMEDSRYPQTRWLKAIQSEFAARADWCVMPYDKANHPPVVTVQQPQRQTVKPGQSVSLKAQVSDPDNNTVTIMWWHYAEAGTADIGLSLVQSGDGVVTFNVPDTIKSGDTIHLIAEATDDAEHPLTRYQRVILTGL